MTVDYRTVWGGLTNDKELVALEHKALVEREDEQDVDRREDHCTS